MGTKGLLMRRVLPAIGAATLLASVGGALLPTQASAAPAGWTSVIVRVGDTLSALAARYGSSVAGLAAANHLRDPNRIIAGEPMQVPGGTGDFQLTDFAVASGGDGIGSASAGWLPTPVRRDPERQSLVPVFQQWAAHYGIDAGLVEAMCWWESGWHTNVVSSTGAMGIGQLEPSTVTQMRYYTGDPTLSPWVASDNIRMSAAYLSILVAETQGNASLALAGYYQGLKDVRRRGFLPSTRQYVGGIMSYAALFRS